jgi:hypothetical protein
MEQPKTHPRVVREFYFWSGIVATIAYRVIVVLNNVSALWVTIAWYVGTIGFVVYFIHRYEISNLRAKLVAQHDLIRKVSDKSELTGDDRQALGYILQTLKTSKEKINSIVIFVSSGLALAVGIYLDFIR